MRRKRADLAVVHHGRGFVLSQNACIQRGTVSDIDGHQYHACAPEPVHENQASPVVGRQKGDTGPWLNAHVLDLRGDPMGHRDGILVADGRAALLDENRVWCSQSSPVQRICSPQVNLLIFSPSSQARW